MALGLLTLTPREHACAAGRGALSKQSLPCLRLLCFRAPCSSTLHSCAAAAESWRRVWDDSLARCCWSFNRVRCSEIKVVHTLARWAPRPLLPKALSGRRSRRQGQTSRALSSVNHSKAPL